ncbi:MAG: hypothetical protein PVF87_12405, partial [Acidimicrobiia bacterium]
PEGCVGGKCLHLEGQLLDLDSYGAYRAADLSMFETVELCFEMDVEVVSEAVLYVYVSPNGSEWRAVEEISLLEPGSLHPIIGLNDFRTEGFRVKFKVAGLTGLEVVTIDNVELKGTVAATTSTTSTSTTSTSTTSTSTTSTSTTSTSTTSTSTTSTTSTTAGPSTSSTDPRADTTRSGAAASTSTTTTTTSTTTSTTLPGTGAGLPPQPPFDSGLRDTAGGLMVDYPTGLMGDMRMAEVDVLGAEVTADFSLAVEVIETGGVWVAVLALFITAALVSGMDRRRSRQGVI